MKTAKEKNMPNYERNDRGQGVSVTVSYPSPEQAKVKQQVSAGNMVNFMGLGQFSDWL